MRGAREIGFTVISLTLSLIAVFIPLLFMTGLVGRMFREFALDAHHRRGGLGDRLADADADDVRRVCCGTSASASGRALTQRFNELHRSHGRTLPAAASNGCCAASADTLLVTLATLAATILLYVVIPKGFCRCRTPA